MKQADSYMSLCSIKEFNSGLLHLLKTRLQSLHLQKKKKTKKNNETHIKENKHLLKHSLKIIIPLSITGSFLPCNVLEELTGHHVFSTLLARTETPLLTAGGNDGAQPPLYAIPLNCQIKKQTNLDLVNFILRF